MDIYIIFGDTPCRDGDNIYAIYTDYSKAQDAVDRLHMEYGTCIFSIEKFSIVF